MTDQAAQQGLDDDTATEEDQAAERPRSKRRTAIIGGVAVLVAVAVLYGVTAWLGLLGGAERSEHRPPVFVELPEMTVNLNTLGTNPQYLRIRASLEVGDDRTRSAVRQALPRVLDAFQLYLRELRPTDLEGSAGMMRLKEELLRRVNIAVHPSEIDGVVFEEIIVQ